MRWIAGGVLFGAAMGGFGLWLGQPGTAEVTATTTSAGAVAVEAATPMSLGPTVLVPLSLAIEESEVVFSYELVGSSDTSVDTVFIDGESPVIAPERWTLITRDGELAGTTANLRARTARFPVGDGFALDRVLAIRLDAYRIRLPVAASLELGWADTDPVPVDDTVALSVKRVLEQRSSTLVQLDIHHGEDPFSAAGGAFGAQFEAGPRVRGDGLGWTNVGGLPDGGIQLTWAGEGRLADPFSVAVTTSSWSRVERPATIGVGGLVDD